MDIFHYFDANYSDDEMRNFYFFSPFSSIFCFSFLCSCYSFFFFFKRRTKMFKLLLSSSLKFEYLVFTQSQYFVRRLNYIIYELLGFKHDKFP